MINCVRDDKKTVVSASGDASRVAADCCEVIRAIYFEIPVEVRPLFKECVLLAVNHKDSPHVAVSASQLGARGDPLRRQRAFEAG